MNNILNDLIDCDNPPKYQKCTDGKMFHRCGFCNKGSYNFTTITTHVRKCRKQYLRNNNLGAD